MVFLLWNGWRGVDEWILPNCTCKWLNDPTTYHLWGRKQLKYSEGWNHYGATQPPHPFPPPGDSPWWIQTDSDQLLVIIVWAPGSSRAPHRYSTPYPSRYRALSPGAWLAAHPNPPHTGRIPTIKTTIICPGEKNACSEDAFFIDINVVSALDVFRGRRSFKVPSSLVRLQRSSVVIGPVFCMVAPGSNPAPLSTSPRSNWEKIQVFPFFAATGNNQCRSRAC